MMKNTLFILICFFTSITLSAQDSLLVIELQKQNKNQEIEIIELRKKLDSLSFQPERVQDSGKIEIQNPEKKLWFEYVFPSAIALIVGLIALIGTIYTGHKQRESSENQLKEQLKQGQKTIANQIESSEKTIQSQIESEKQVAELNFRQNVLSVNRQIWINDLRSIMSEIISMTRYCGLKKTMLNDDFRKLEGLILKAELMVNPEKDKDFISALKKLNTTLYDVLLKKKDYADLSEPESAVLELTKKTLKTEWERVKKGE